jgi:hypothetical protein
MLERIDLERVEQRAAQWRPGPIALAALTVFFFALGWVIGTFCRGLWLAVTWSASAVVEGWQAGWKANQRPMVRRRVGPA